MVFQKGHKDLVSKEARKRAGEKISIKFKGVKRKPLSKEHIAAIIKARTGIHFKWSEKAKEKRRKQWAGKSWGTHRFKKGFIPWNKGLKKKDDVRLQKLADDRKGEKNWNYKGGITQNKRDNCKRELREWRIKVFERDNYTCQKYKIKGGILSPHHIKNVADNPELMLEVSNGITLSEKAHKEFHRIYGVKNNNLIQLQEFIKNYVKDLYPRPYK